MMFMLLDLAAFKSSTAKKGNLLDVCSERQGWRSGIHRITSGIDEEACVHY